MVNQIDRMTGPFRSRWGIRLDKLEPYHQKILLENPLLEERSKNDMFLLILFRMADRSRSHKRSHKLYCNPYRESFTKYKDVLEDSKYIDWKCAITGKPIKSEIGNFEPNNFLCKECIPEYGNRKRTVDKRIIQNSLEFREHCKKILLQQQKLHLKNVKKSSQADL